VLRLSVVAGARVKRGGELMVIESMKVRIPIRANASGHVRQVHVKVGDHVQRERVLVRIES
jgi:biotin carboxyl carrier protein